MLSLVELPVEESSATAATAAAKRQPAILWAMASRTAAGEGLSCLSGCGEPMRSRKALRVSDRIAPGEDMMAATRRSAALQGPRAPISLQASEQLRSAVCQKSSRSFESPDIGAKSMQSEFHYHAALAEHHSSQYRRSTKSPHSSDDPFDKSLSVMGDPLGFSILDRAVEVIRKTFCQSPNCAFSTI